MFQSALSVPPSTLTIKVQSIFSAENCQLQRYLVFKFPTLCNFRARNQYPGTIFSPSVIGLHQKWPWVRAESQQQTTDESQVVFFKRLGREKEKNGMGEKEGKNCRKTFWMMLVDTGCGCLQIVLFSLWLSYRQGHGQFWRLQVTWCFKALEDHTLQDSLLQF